MEVWTFVIVTAAFGTTAPDWSRTMPTMVAVSNWAAATAGKAQAQARTHATAKERCGITHLLVATTASGCLGPSIPKEVGLAAILAEAGPEGSNDPPVELGGRCRAGIIFSARRRRPA